jgi:hypothetical protein
MVATATFSAYIPASQVLDGACRPHAYTASAGSASEKTCSVSRRQVPYPAGVAGVQTATGTSLCVTSAEGACTQHNGCCKHTGPQFRKGLLAQAAVTRTMPQDPVTARASQQYRTSIATAEPQLQATSTSTSTTTTTTFYTMVAQHAHVYTGPYCTPGSAAMVRAALLDCLMLVGATKPPGGAKGMPPSIDCHRGWRLLAVPTLAAAVAVAATVPCAAIVPDRVSAAAGLCSEPLTAAAE